MSRTPEEMLAAAVFDDFIYEFKPGEKFPIGKKLKLRLNLPKDIQKVVFSVEYMARKIAALIVPPENTPLTERDCEIEFLHKSNPGDYVHISVDSDEKLASCDDTDASNYPATAGSRYYFILRYLE
jgi:hypothetical protein